MYRAQEEPVVGDSVRFAAPALLEHIERMSSIHCVMLPTSNEKLAARSKRTKNLNLTSKQLLTAPWSQAQEQPRACPDHVLSGERR